MMTYAYTVQTAQNEASAVGQSMPISTKFAVEICNQLRGKTVAKAKNFLESVIQKKRAVPMKRYNRDQAHKPGIAAGRYPIKACQAILTVLKNAEANAQFKGLSTASLSIKHISAKQGPKAWRLGRKRRRRAKRTHVEIILAEQKREEQARTKND